LLGAKTGFALQGRELELPADADADGTVWVCAVRTQMDNISTKAREKNPALLIANSLWQFVVMNHSILPVFSRSADRGPQSANTRANHKRFRNL
jgi:hypothetical protein